MFYKQIHVFIIIKYIFLKGKDDILTEKRALDDSGHLVFLFRYPSTILGIGIWFGKKFLTNFYIPPKETKMSFH